MVVELKHCPSCDLSKSLDQYYLSRHVKSGKKGVASYRKSCATKKAGEWHAKNIARCQERRRERTMQSYGLSGWDEYERLLAAQGGVCAICGVDSCPRYGRLSVDHDHATGAVRGLLCHACNIMLGSARDRISTLQRAAQYLKRAAVLAS